MDWLLDDWLYYCYLWSINTYKNVLLWFGAITVLPDLPHVIV